MFRRLSESLRRFMYGRYGTDALNMVILVTGLVLSFAASILTWVLDPAVKWVAVVLLILHMLVYGLMGWALFRMFSRNIVKRQRENRRLQQLWLRLRDRKNRYFRCPKCNQTVRVPRNRGRIKIRCPRCGDQFEKKT